MSYIVDDPVSVINQNSTQLVEFAPSGNVTTVDSYGFLKNNNTVTWALNNNQPSSYKVVYPQNALSNFQGLIMNATDNQNLISYFLEAPNTKIVRSNPAPGQYSTVRSAVESITTSAYLQPFTVWVQPGTYVESNLDPITLPFGTFVSGFGPDQTILVDHRFNVIANTANLASPGSFGLNNATFKRLNQSSANTFLDVSSNLTLGLILDSEFEDWKRLFNVSAGSGTTLKIGGIGTSLKSTTYPNMIANITYGSSNTGSNVEINRSSFIMDSSDVPFSVFGPESNFCAGGFNLRNCSFNSTSLNDKDFINATSFSRMILKNLNISGYSNILTISGAGLNTGANLSTFVFSDIKSNDNRILIQDNANFVTSFGYPAIGLANYYASTINNSTDLNKIFLNNQKSRIPFINLDDLRETHFRDIPTFEDFTNPSYPYFDVPWSMNISGTANITNVLPTLSSSSVVNGFGTIRVLSTNDGFQMSPPVTGMGINTSQLLFMKIGCGLTPLTGTGVGNTTTMIGFGDSNSVSALTANNAATNNGIYFAYSPATAPFAANFNCVYKNTTVSAFDSGVPVSNGAYYNLDIEYTRINNTAETKWYINEQLVKTFPTSNFQTGVQLYPMMKYFSNNGAGAWSVDYLSMLVRVDR